MSQAEAARLTMGKATRDAFGEALRDLGRERPEIVVVDGDVSNSTRTEWFGKEFPDRFFNCGIAESNMVGVAAGLAAGGKVPFCASFAAFLLCNAFDQLRMSVAFPRLNVKLVGSHAGISIGEDGPSQMAIEDIALALALPGMTVVVPADEHSTRDAVRALADLNGPAYLRVGRPNVPIVYDGPGNFTLGKANTLRQGADLTIVACGLMVAVALEAAAVLAGDGVQARVLDMHTVRPLDEVALLAAASETGAIVVAEEHLTSGGLASQVALVLAQHRPTPLRVVGLSTYAESGKPQELLDKYGLTSEAVATAARAVLAARGNRG
jgi:transketolase